MIARKVDAARKIQFGYASLSLNMFFELQYFGVQFVFTFFAFSLNRRRCFVRKGRGLIDQLRYYILQKASCCSNLFVFTTPAEITDASFAGWKLNTRRSENEEHLVAIWAYGDGRTVEPQMG